MHEDVQGTAEEIEVRIFTLPQSAKRGDVNGLASNRVLTVRGGIRCSGHTRQEKVAASSFYVRSVNV